MSFFRRPRPPDKQLPRPQDARSLHDYAVRLCRAGVPTETAKELLLRAQRQHQHQQQPWPGNPQFDRERQRREAQRAGAEVAALALLRSIGALDEEPDADVAGPTELWTHDGQPLHPVDPRWRVMDG